MCWSFLNFGVVYGVFRSSVSFKQTFCNILSGMYQTPSWEYFAIEDPSILNAAVNSPRKKWPVSLFWANANAIFIDILILTISFSNTSIIPFGNKEHVNHQLLFSFSIPTWNLLYWMQSIRVGSHFHHTIIPRSNQRYVISTVRHFILPTRHCRFLV